MPELHKLTPPLGVLQDRGFKVALVTDGRMSGASGKVPAAIHVTPEAAERRPARPAARRRPDPPRCRGAAGSRRWSTRPSGPGATAVEPDLARNAPGHSAASCSAASAPQVTSAELGAAAISFLPEPQACTRAEADARF